MNEVTFITGNQDKADYLLKYLDFSVDFKKLDLTEIQSMDLKEVAEHKAKEAYKILDSPVIVDDVSVEFQGLNGLPGPFIKFFLERFSYEEICRLVDGKSRKAYASCIYGFYDGKTFDYIQGHLNGTVAEHPEGDNGFGWDKIFIVEGNTKPRATLSDSEYLSTIMTLRPLDKLKIILEKHLG